MTLLEIISKIKSIGSRQPNIHTILDDVYDLNTINVEANYSAFCVQQNQHRMDGDFITYNFYLFYVDRLLSDKSNMLEIQSTGIQVLSNIVRTLDLESGSDVSASTFQVFTQRFEAECAGVYLNVGVTVPLPGCAHYMPDDNSFNDDYNKDYD